MKHNYIYLDRTFRPPLIPLAFVDAIFICNSNAFPLLQYCKYYMVKFCPHDLFVNTRADLGACPKVHDDEVKELFEKAESSYKKAQYVEEFLRFCRHMINDVEREYKQSYGIFHIYMMTTTLCCLSPKIVCFFFQVKFKKVNKDWN